MNQGATAPGEGTRFRGSPTVASERQPVPRRRLSGKYAAYLLVLVSGTLLASSAVNLFLGHRELQAHLHDVQAREARTAATRIEQFLADVDDQIAWALRPVQAAGTSAPEERRVAYLGLLRLNPAITQIRYLDCQGREQLAVSRVAMERLGAGGEVCPVAAGPLTAAAYSPVEFEDGYPYVLVTVHEGASGGATVAQVNLTFVWDVVSRITVGRDACAYLLDAGGRLIAHPDVNLVLQRPSVGSLPQVCRGSGREPGSGRPSAAASSWRHQLGRLLYRREAFSQQERIGPAGWTVVVEHPVEAAIAPLVASLLGTGALLLLGLAFSVAASRVLARKMVAPIYALQGFLDPNVAALIASGARLEMHWAEVTVVFCDLRGYTAFAERTQPEHLIEFLREYHELLGPIIAQHGGTLERFTGDGVMVFFNDPVRLPNPQEQAVRMALAMRDDMRGLTENWRRRRNVQLGFGIGIDHDYAWLGRIGYEGRWDYAAIGKVTNCAARVCSEAADRQVLVTQPVYAAVEALVEAELVGDLELKGFHEPIRVYNVAGLK